MKIVHDDLGFLNCMIKKYACNLLMNYKNINIDTKSVSDVIKLLTPEYIAEINTVFTPDGLNLYIYHGLHKYLKSDATFTPLSLWTIPTVTV